MNFRFRAPALASRPGTGLATIYLRPELAVDTRPCAHLEGELITERRAAASCRQTQLHRQFQQMKEGRDSAAIGNAREWKTIYVGAYECWLPACGWNMAGTRGNMIYPIPRGRR